MTLVGCVLPSYCRSLNTAMGARDAPRLERRGYYPGPRSNVLKPARVMEGSGKPLAETISCTLIFINIRPVMTRGPEPLARIPVWILPKRLMDAISLPG